MGSSHAPSATRAALLRRTGLVFVEPGGGPATDDQVRAIELELADLGYVASTRLRARLAELGPRELAAWRDETCAALAARLGADQKHVPLFRRFPEGIPADTFTYWVRKVLVHYFQGQDQPCLFCRRTGTTHVLSPCHHVVCDHCYDGSNLSACPVCERHVDPGSPFFRPAPDRHAPTERVRFELLDLGERLDDAMRDAVAALCARTQPMSPTDRDDLVTLVRDAGLRALPWLPPVIPVKEHVALVFGTLFRHCPPDAVLPAARAHLRTATDVLRFVAVYSGADPALAGEARLVSEPGPGGTSRRVSRRTFRFKVAKLSRPVRRALLALLDGMDPDLLVEDLLRHRSYWVWVGEFLHPHEYARRFPRVARGFAIVRGQAPDGTPAPAFRTFHGKVEAAAAAGDAVAMVTLLRQRPGELARRYDHALRVAGADARAAGEVSAALGGLVDRFATPVLLTLRSLLPTRVRPAPVRLFWPKGTLGRGVSARDRRPALPADAIAPAVRAVEAELLRRFAARPAFEECVVDAALAGIVVPFNERTASRGAVALPRGSRLALPPGKVVRLFLHWCQPEVGGRPTDIDLSVGFYDADWKHVGVCSYYQLEHRVADEVIASSAGDLQDAPFPDGATELIDLDRARARAAGIRYAVMVVNAYRGMAFGKLERAFAGVMLRDDRGGHHFDARTVELKFDLQGEHGMFAPLAIDLEADVLDWLDVYSKGALELNNVATSNQDITRICDDMMAYFGSGLRPSMYDLALLHAAARAQRVYLRNAGGAGMRLLARAPGEHAAAFLARLVAGGGAPATPRLDRPVLAALLHGDLALPAGSTCYALFRDQVTSPIAAAELLA